MIKILLINFLKVTDKEKGEPTTEALETGKITEGLRKLATKQEAFDQNNEIQKMP